MTMEHTQHVSVMLDEVLEYLQPIPGGLYIDGTLGGGGHTAAILERSAPDGKVLGIDTDSQALARVGERLAEFVANGRLVLAHGNFSDLAEIVEQTGFGSGHGVQGVLLDLGFSSDQMDNPERGFAFSADGPLDMRLDQALPLTAEDLVNGASEQELADIFWRYGEESRSRQIARRIVREREKAPITRTAQLAALIAAGVPHKPGSIHPATRAFQALRIAVNRELERLETVLPQIVDVLEGEKKSDGGGREGEKGRMVIIAFHSLEDRIVKEFIRREAKDCLCPPRLPVCVCGHKARLRNLTNKPVTPGEQEIANNPRARSAKLRAAEIANN
ncbi:16S rRNA (cytosine(1402)-N(4))-methyltransferase RsmH [Dictyobacter kobayashii]|uniref:Ribosomal RNA small subunit methyltransferase H n=1 Tax=Dictyobacter kobayashii TaxID=2014872 RepID=A0A402AG66_9CHLR|nr:16S rRNA (cytosine(1402)-N(4))-methyltransferase RsmH [Dictyobacter kobayashii]GCE18111.1 ribosomal RNA small subunit methyltransferase H [Dictyobacter kobayashii]